MATETTILKLTAPDLKEIVNPTNDTALFQYGNAPGIMSEAGVVKLMESEESNTLSAFPEHYRRVIQGESAGEILTPSRGARGGETVLQTAFYPLVSGTLVLYKNWADNNLPWESRKYEYALTETTDYTVNEATGAITLTAALEEEDTVYADYQHDGGALFTAAKEVVLKACRLELYSRFPNWNDSTDVIQEMREYIDGKLLSFNAEPHRGIAEIDDVRYMTETRLSQRETMKRPYMRGAL